MVSIKRSKIRDKAHTSYERAMCPHHSTSDKGSIKTNYIRAKNEQSVRISQHQTKRASKYIRAVGGEASDLVGIPTDQLSFHKMLSSIELINPKAESIRRAQALQVNMNGRLRERLATVPVYSYDRTDYGRPPYNEEVSPVRVRVPAVSVPYTCRTSVYGHIIQPLRH
ncbi:hypothetical protein PILCRDRAFT_852 [Piloderma croceum F 1598]|uniref:Uncharacterized protein n=1 Tax=Piloderma croceum (strain F 1598) TaxID=765440 RepID=A0A0C3GMK6_PILCF|nr:hypothetical protein PILCRDRAFT_852 [Piloderma croceum F 1598]